MIGAVLILLAQAAPVTTAAKANPATDNKVVCKTSAEAHSRIPNRVCMTKARWAQIERETEEDIRSAYGGTQGRKGTIVNGAMIDSRSIVGWTGREATIGQ